VGKVYLGFGLAIGAPLRKTAGRSKGEIDEPAFIRGIGDFTRLRWNKV